MSMTRLYERWEDLDDLFEQAVSLPPDEVEAFCRSACGEDGELYELLHDLVTAAEVSDETVRRSISKLAHDVASDKPLTGERIGAYQLEGLLGRGGMGDVYLASRADGAFDKKVAVKVVRSRQVADQFTNHFRRERRVLASLNHPSIPPLIDAGQLDDGRLYFIGGYVDGVPISDYCDDNALSEEQKLTLLTQVGEALQHAHNNLVLHLDIKPDNVLVEADGRPCLLDFGIARLMDDEAEGYRAFTPGYASPEQIRGEYLTAASDVFSLGALMFRIFSGHPPFSAPRFAPSRTILAEREGFAERLPQLDELRELHPDLQAIIRKAMADDPAERYRTVESFLLDLKYYRNHLPVSARDKTYGYRVGKYLRRHKLAIGAVALVFAVLTAFGLREAELRSQAQEASAVAAREAETARQVSEFVIDLFEVSDPGEARGNSVTARELLDQGAQRVSNDLADQPLIAAQFLTVIGSVYVGLGLFPRASEMFESARALRETIDDQELELAQVLTRLGDVYTRLSRFDDAESVLRQALDHQERAAQPDYVGMEYTYETLGTLYMRLGRTDEAEDMHQLGITLAEEHLGADHPEYASHLAALARVYYDQGRNEESEALHLRAIGILQNAWGEDHPDLGLYFENIGNLYNHMQRYDEAANYMRRALALREQVLEANHPMLSYSLLNLSVVLINQDRLDEAEPYLLRAIAIQEEIFEPDDFRLALSRMNLGELYFKRGELGEASRLARMAENSMTKSLGPDHTYLGFAHLLLAEIHFAGGNVEAARPHFERAYAVHGGRPEADPVRINLIDKYVGFLRATGRDAEADALAPRP